MYILSKEEMYQADKYTIENIGIPGYTLMECAGQSMTVEIEKIIYEIEKKSQSKIKIAVLCGSGNNGGDGLVVARRLLQKKYNIETILCTSEENIKGDALKALSAYQNSNYKLELYKEGKKSGIEELISNSDIIIDAILGIGSRRAISEPYKTIINMVNASSAKIISLDIPSGTLADENTFENSIEADITLSVQHPKVSTYTYPAATNYGEVNIINAGIVMPEYKNFKKLWTKEDHIKNNSNEKLDAHKGDNGRIVIVGGSKNMVGAPIMSALACARAGAGLISLAIPQININVASQRLLEAMYIDVTEEDGYITDIEIPKADIITLGMGIGRNPKTANIVKKIISSDSNIILDADALYFLRAYKDMLKPRKGLTIITPHEGEMAQICGLTSEDIKNNRFEISKKFAQEHQIYTVLKGPNTILSCPNGNQYVNSSGNQSLAKGGSGDVLAGIIAAKVGKALKSKNIDIVETAIIDSIYIHGNAADELVAKKKTYHNIIATDIIEQI